MRVYESDARESCLKVMEEEEPADYVKKKYARDDEAPIPWDIRKLSVPSTHINSSTSQGSHPRINSYPVPRIMHTQPQSHKHCFRRK